MIRLYREGWHNPPGTPLKTGKKIGEETTMGDIGTNPRKIEVMPVTEPVRQPQPAPAVAPPVKEPEKVPA